MKSASQSFDASELQQVNDAVSAAEAKTSAEIVPAVATAAGRYDRAEDIVGLFFGLGAMSAVWSGYQGVDISSTHWGQGGLLLQLPMLILVVMVGFMFGVATASRVAWLRHLFTPRSEMKAEVMRAAQSVFFDQRVHHTAGASGLLLYVSLYERQAVLLADKDVLAAIGQDALDGVCARLVGGLREGSITAALCASITEVGELLSGKMPRADDDVNELPDALVLID